MMSNKIGRNIHHKLQGHGEGARTKFVNEKDNFIKIIYHLI